MWADINGPRRVPSWTCADNWYTEDHPADKDIHYDGLGNNTYMWHWTYQEGWVCI